MILLRLPLLAAGTMACAALNAATFTVSITNDAGPGSLRAAITNVNGSPGPHVIVFNLPEGTRSIRPLSALPVITNSATLDGTTQPGYSGKPLVELAGVSAGGISSGLRLSTSNSIIRGLVLNRWRANGIEINGGRSNAVEGCYIGTGVEGTTDLGNLNNGILIVDSPGNRIGGPTAALRNVISGNDDHGIRINGTNSVGTGIFGNILGLDETGQVDLGNNDHGILIDRAVETAIGGSTPATGNVISGNNGHGIRVEGTGARGTVIRNNRIGLNSAGLTDLGNNLDGISVANSPDTTIGGPGTGNGVAGNGGAGVRLDGAVTTNVVVFGNRIGIDDSGVGGIPNQGAGIEIANGARFNRLGGTGPGEGNVIAFNGADGVFVSGGTNNAVRGNAHFGNVGLGLDLGSNGIQANDATDADTGANQLQNFPILRRGVLRETAVEIEGEFRGAANTTLALDVFASTAPDASGNGEGERFLGTFDVTTDATGFVRFTRELPAATSLRFLTATATDPFGNTSEFSPSLRALTSLPPNIFVVTTTADSGPGSLRQAILDANAALNLGDRITFALPGAGPHVISVATALPAIGSPVTLDGFTQPGASPNTLADGFNGVLQVHLDGATAPINTDGLQVATPGVTVRGLGIERFRGDGIELSPTSAGAVIEGNVLGLAPDGTDAGQNGSGVLVSGSSGHRIGGTVPSARNVISGNNRSGIELSGAGATEVRIEGNWIGVGLDGISDRGNSLQGIRLDNAPGNALGGALAGAGNVIAGNDQHGIELANAGSSNNVILGNFIGSTATGSALRNNFNGVQVAGSGNRVGGAAAGEGNRIRFNGQRGIGVQGGTNNAVRGNSIQANEALGIDLGNNNRNANDEGDADTGPNQLQNFPVLLGGTIQPGATRISGRLNSAPSSQFTLDFYSSPAPDVSGNGEGDQYLGAAEITTDASGNATFDITLPAEARSRFLTATATDRFGNTSEFSASHVAGSTLAPRTFTITTVADSGPGSLRQALLDADEFPAGGAHTLRFNIPGNGPHSITPATALPIPVTESVIVDGYTQPGAKPNTLAVGSDAVLKIVLDGTDRPVDHGLRLLVPGNTLRGLAVVSFVRDNLLLGGGSNVVEGCWIGLLPDGTAKIRDSGNSGITLANTLFGTGGSPGNRIGGSTPAARNVIGGHPFGNGIFIAGGGGSNNVVLGNLIGTDPTGTLARPNRTGVAISGIDAPDNRVGGTGPGDGNLISGNTGSGIVLSGADRTLVLGNRIGTDATGEQPLPNGGDGINVSVSPGSRIGGVEPGAGNRIAFNSGAGISLSGDPRSVGLAVRGNAIRENGSLGFDVGGFGIVDFNDVGDVDTGPNQRQNFPVITSARVDDGSVTIAGDLDSLPGRTYQLDFYANRLADPSEHGEGSQYLGSRTVTTDANGDASFNVTFPVAPIGNLLTATATDTDGNSSEFSKVFQAGSTLAGRTFVVTHTQDSGPGSLRQAILDNNANPTSGNRIEFNIPGDGVKVIQPITALPGITAAVLLDGYTQPGARPNTLPDGNDAVLRIHLNSPSAPVGAGLVVSDSGSVIRGLAVSGFAPGIILRGTNNAMTGCWIGLAPDGTDRQNFLGLLLDQGRDQKVGGTAPGDRNVVSGNRDGAIRILAPGVVVSGNFIGTDPSGRIQRSAAGPGIEITLGGDVTLGGVVTSARNVITGHSPGIRATQISTLLIANNHIGVDVTGTNALGNSTGVELSDVVNARVDANVISENLFLGVSIVGSRDGNNVITGNAIGTDVTGTRDLGNGNAGIAVSATTALRIGGPTQAEANHIAHNGDSGIAVLNPDATVFIRGNRIHDNSLLGIDRGLRGPTPNEPGDTTDPTNYPELTDATLNADTVRVRGVLIGAAQAVYRMDFYASPAPDSSGFGEGAQYLGSITNTADAAGRIVFDAILGAVASGRWISATATDASGDTSEFSPAVRATSTRPPGSFTVTTDADEGPGSLREALTLADGVLGSENTRIRFQIPGAGPFRITPRRPLPVTVEPVTLDGFTQPGATPNTDPERDTAQRAIHLVGSGLDFGQPGLVLASPGNLVRGLVLSQFDAAALVLTGNSNQVEGCLVESNRSVGIRITGGFGHRIGGPQPAQRNRFLDNASGHILAEFGSGGPLQVQGNFLGVDADGLLGAPAFPIGIQLAGTGPSLIGGSLPGEANVINSPNPVDIIGGRGHTVRGNRALSGGLPIPNLPSFDNDPGDGDEGPNGLQNAPSITGATVTPGGTRITGTINSRPSASFVLDFYSTPASVVGGPLLLERYLGSAPVNTDASGNAAFNILLPQKARRGRILATATDANGNTSETGTGALTTTEIPPPRLSVTRSDDSGPGSLRAALLESEDTFATGPGTISFNVPGAGPHRIELQTPLPHLTQPVIVDGFTQPGAVGGPAGRDLVLQVGLDGSGLDPGAVGLVLTGAGHRVQGLIFTGFGGAGIVLRDAPGSTIERNWFGYDGDPDPGIPVLGSPSVASAARTSLRRAGAGDDRNLGVGIRVETLKPSQLGKLPETRILDNIIANTETAGVRASQVGDLRLLGNRIGVGPDGLRYGGEINAGISLEDVRRIEVIRDPSASLFGENVIAGCGVALLLKNSRECRIEGNTFGGGTFGDWRNANRVAVWLDGVQSTGLRNNRLSFNGRGVEVWGQGFGTQINGNLLGDNSDFGLRAGDLSLGYRLGDFQVPNHFGIGPGSPLVIASRSVFDAQLNRFGAHGVPLLHSPAVAAPAAPRVDRNDEGIVLSGFSAQPFDLLSVYSSDALRQRLDLAANFFLEGGTTQWAVPLRGPLFAESNRRTIGAVFTGRPAGTSFGFAQDGETDLEVELVPGASFGSGSPPGTSRYWLEVRLRNLGPETASYLARVRAPGASAMEPLPRFQWIPPSIPSLRDLNVLGLDAGEIDFTGRIAPGETVYEAVAITLAPGIGIEASIAPTDRKERTPANNTDTAQFPGMSLGSAATTLRFHPGELSSASTGGNGLLHFGLENMGLNPATGVRIRLPDSPSVEWLPSASVDFDAVRESSGLHVLLKKPLSAGASLNLGLSYKALSRPGYFQIPVVVSGFPQNPESPPPGGWGLFEILSPGQLDYGDAPNSYGTTRAAQGPSHIAVPGFHLGFSVAPQADGLPGTLSNQDADEEGVFFPDPLVPGRKGIVEVRASAAGMLDAWIDWNRNGVFDHRPPGGLNEYLPDLLDRHPSPGDSYPLQPGLNRLHFTIPTAASLGSSGARFRFSHDGGLGPRGAGSVGEVEDYRVEVYSAPPDFGDAPDFEASPGYPTLPSHDGAAHILTSDSPRLGFLRDGEAFPFVDASAFGDDVTPGTSVPESDDGNDEDGVLLLGQLAPGADATIRLITTIPNGGRAKIDAWVDWNGDFDWDDAGEQVASRTEVIHGTNFFTIQVPATARIGFTFARVRISTNGGLTPRGTVQGGEVEDYSLVVNAPVGCVITSASRVGNQLLIAWTGGAVLQQAPTLDGPWTNVPGQAPGNSVVPMEEAARFFRLQCP
ncbi:MAG: right-handed parallel beta-helix repeat-containing protein [Verrucomicrobiales bacterium]|nr:right-handed parallel beta-helix repeat-containing protein [Verrucomicrobiales bacterium]